jgi:S1-C subfamily serine protease
MRERNMKWKYSSYFFIVLSSILLIILIVFLVINSNNQKRIFDKSISKVVEIRVSNDGANFYYGSGCYISKTIILTNKHLIESGDGSIYTIIQYRRFNKDDFENIIQVNKVYSDVDLSELKVDNNNNYFKIRDTKIGSKCYAIGNNSGNGLVFLEGVISGETTIILEQTVTKMIISTIPINRGMSGGALIDSSGHLIGLLTLRLRDVDDSPVYALSYSGKYTQLSKLDV